MTQQSVDSLHAIPRKRNPTIDREKDSIENIELDTLVWLSSREAAQYLRKSYGALKVMVSRGQVRARKYRRRLYFKRRELDELLENSEHIGGF